MKSAKTRSSPGRNTHAGRPTYLFADPWRFRSVSSRRMERVAGLHGQAIESRIMRRGGVLVDMVPHHLVDVDDVPEAPSEPKNAISVLRRRQSAALSRYRRQGWCTAIDLRTIAAMWVGGFGTRQLARVEGVSPTAISDRVARLRFKAPEFWRWYRLRRLYGVAHGGAGTRSQRGRQRGSARRPPAASDIVSDIELAKPENGRERPKALARVRRR
jgi:hypothetical protein